MAEAMDWAEIKMRLRDGTSVDILADLNGVPYKTMYNRIMAHQIKDNVTYLTPKNTRGGMNKSKAISKTKQAQAKEKKAAQKAAERPEVNHNSDLPTCKDCANASHRDNQPFCMRGHGYGETSCCSEYEKYIPEEKQDIPEEVYNMRRVPDLPEDISNSTILDVLADIKRSHAEAVQTMHDAESMLEQARTSERQLRTILIAVQRLADAETGQEFPEVMN